MSKRFLRPPGAQDEAHFQASCIRCGKCTQICPYRTISEASFFEGLSMLGTPVIDARNIPCYLCMKCPPVCPSGALDRSLIEKNDVRMGLAEINKDTCYAWQGTLCRSCYENCPIFDEAITMDTELRPVVHEKKCVGCGICENVCPVNEAAIIAKPKDRK
jgi:MauM/NapG family ferredoxin protein